MQVGTTSFFLRQLKKLPKDLQEEVLDVIEIFAHEEQHARLRVHKLKGRLAGRYSFSVNYRFRIVFCYQNKEAILLAIGDHNVYT